MMIHQQLFPPKQLLPHITNTSKNFFERSVAHSMVFREAKKVRKNQPSIIYKLEPKSSWVRCCLS